MSNSLKQWLENVFHMPTRLISVLAAVHDIQKKVHEIDAWQKNYDWTFKERLQEIEDAIHNIPECPRPDYTPIHQHIDTLTTLTGTIRAAQNTFAPDCKLAQAEFKVFSQFGDDGIIDYLISKLNVTERRFVEFGVESYQESNTRFLLLHRNWSGLIMDGGAENIEFIKRQEMYWRHDLTAVCAFIDVDNINKLIEESGFGGRIGLLSVDIDGNDYWVWRAINVCNPAIVVSEYNSTFGPEACVTVPYAPDFQRTKAHYSNLYWGASLAALHKLAQEKGYSFVGCNNAGNNAYFVRNDLMAAAGMKALTPREGFVAARFRESRDSDGTLTFAPPEQRKDIIGDCQVFDVGDLKMVPVKQLPWQ